MAMDPKNVFNNKADFKVLLPLDRFRMTVGAGYSAKGLGGA
jgi:hypothetical protein